MDKYRNVLIIQAVLIFVAVSVILFVIYSEKKQKKKIVKRRNIYSNFPLRSLVTIFAASLGVTLFLNSVENNTITSVMVFSLLMFLLPYALLNNQERLLREAIFDDVILYCQNMAMLLKQSHNAYSSLKKVQEDLQTSLADDVAALIAALDNGREATIESMAIIEKNYPYTCIQNLDVIILHMQFEHANINDSLIMLLQEDIDALEKDVRDNKIKRRILRIQYIFITAACFITYWFFIKQIRPSFADGFEKEIFKVGNAVYILSTLVSLFFVDRYFNSTTTKE